MASASRKRKASSKGIRQQREMQLAIGTFVVNFSQLEWFAHDFVLSLSRDEILGRKVAGQEFGRRVETLIELSRQRVDKNLRHNWIDIWTKARALAEHRNAIVHNPPLVAVFTNPWGEVKGSGFVLHLFRRESGPLPYEMPHYTTRQIRGYARQAQRLAGRVITMIGKWPK